MSTPVPRITVVIPAYDAGRWIGRTVASVRAQTLTDFEVIVVDDGSPDDVVGALGTHLDDPRIRVVRQENRGLAGARNRGVGEARAPLIAPLDADDLWHPEFLAETVAALETNPDAPFAFAYSFRMDADDNLLPFHEPGKPLRHDFYGQIWLNTVGSGSAAVYRRDAMIAAGLYDEAMGARGEHGAEDWKLVILMARHGDPVLVQRHLVGYRLLEDSMSMKRPRRQLDAILAVLREVRAGMPDVPAQHFRDGRTMMTAWLLPVFVKRGQLHHFVREAVIAYGGNPLWFRNELLRRSHGYRILASIGFFGRILNPFRRPYTHLSEAEFEGRRAYAFLRQERNDDAPS